MRLVLDWYYRLLKVALTLMMALLLVPVTLQVSSRYTPFVPTYYWTEEISRFAFVWIILLGSIIAIRDKTHFVVDVLPRVSPRAERMLAIIPVIAMLTIGVIFTYGGWKFVQFGMPQRSELAGLPMVAIFAAWPILGVSCITFTIDNFLRSRNADTKDEDIGTL